MCGRFTLSTPLPELARLFGAELGALEPVTARYNIAPTDPIVVVRRHPEGGGRELTLLRWGLLPSWVRDPRDFPTLINARAESLHRKPAFKDALRERRCLVPADGFYEWRQENGKQPYFVRAREPEPLAFAGLWERWLAPDGEPVETCTVITTDANELVRPLHDRMPAILTPAGRERWMDPSVRRLADLREMLRPIPAELLVAHRVGRRVNRTEEEGPELIEPMPDAGRERPRGSAAQRASGRDGEGPRRPEDRKRAEQLDLLGD